MQGGTVSRTLLGYIERGWTQRHMQQIHQLPRGGSCAQAFAGVPAGSEGQKEEGKSESVETEFQGLWGPLGSQSLELHADIKAL